jgi:translation initiation factor IF-3
MDAKQEKAIEIIASQISKIPANTIMDYGTLGHTQGKTKREGAASEMAAQFAKMMGFTPAANREDDQARIDLINTIVTAAVAKTGK